MLTRPVTKLVLSGLGLIVVVCLWLYVAPTGIGGSTSYVVTHGTSMQPRFHAGDLALVRARDEYRVGEVVAYRSHVFHTVVLHRIIGRAGSRYIFKGDNNNFVDFEHPTRSQLIGSLWLRLPGVGGPLESLRSPLLTGALVGLGFFLLTGVVLTRRRRRRQRERRASAEPRVAHAWPRLGGVEPAVLAVGGLALLPFLALAVISLTRASSAAAPVTIPYKQTGTLSYSAAAAPGPTYQDGRVSTGEPLFTHLVSGVSLRFAYALHSEGTASVSGRAWLGAELSSSSGWRSTMRLAPTVRFHGARAAVRASLSLPALLSLMNRVEKTTAVNGSYVLTIEPHVKVAGRLQSQPISTGFSPKIKFTINPLEVRALSASGSAFMPGERGASPFAPSQSSSLDGERQEPLSISIGPLQPQVATARWIALGGVLLVLLVVLSLGTLLAPRRHDTAADILARYGRMIVPVERVPQPQGVTVIDVADMDALTRIAEHYDRSILHEKTEHGDAFWVTDESGHFRYTAPAEAQPGESVAPARVAIPSEPPVPALSQHLVPIPPTGAEPSRRSAIEDEHDWAAYRVASAIAADGQSWGEAGEAADPSLYQPRR
jgi:signal peptidase I